jgi:hypothetical protein
MTQHDLENDPMSSPPARRYRTASATEAVSPESSPVESAPRPLSSRIGGSASRSSRPGVPGRAKSGDQLNSMQRGTMTPRRQQRTVPRTPMTARSKARIGSLSALDLAKNIYSLDMSSDNVSVASSIASTIVQPPLVNNEKEGSYRESRSRDKDRTRDRSRSQSRGRRQGGRNRKGSSSKDSPPSSLVDMGEEKTLPLKDHDQDRERLSNRRDRDHDRESSSSRLGASVSSMNSPGNSSHNRSRSLNARAAVRASNSVRDKNSKNWKSPLPEKLSVAVSEDEIRNFLAAPKPMRQQGELQQLGGSLKDREQRSDLSPVRSTHTISSIPVRRGEREKSESSLESSNANLPTIAGSRPPRSSRGIGRSRSGEGLGLPPKSSDGGLHQSCHLDYMGATKTRPAPRAASRGVSRATSASSAERSVADRDSFNALNETTRSEMPRQSRPRRVRGSGSQGGDDADLNTSTRSEMILRPPASSSSSSSSKPRDSSRLRRAPLKAKSNDDVIFEMRRMAASDAAKTATENGGGNRDEKARDLNVFLGQVSRRTKKSSNSGSRSVSSLPMRPRHRAATPAAIAQRIRNNSRRNIFVDGNESTVSSEQMTDEEPSEEDADGVDYADYASFRVQLDEVAHVSDEISDIYDDDNGTIGYEDLKPDSNNFSDLHGGLGRSIQDLMVGDERELQLHMHRTDDLLFSVFPKHVAEALRQGKKVEPEHHDMVTIFFSDIVGFTDISATLNPMKISEMLDRLYNAFDALSHYHDVFKVRKTHTHAHKKK